MKCFRLVLVGSTAMAVLVLTGPLSCARQAAHDHSSHDHAADHPAHGHADHAAPPSNSAVPAAKDYADAMRRIQGHMASLDAIIKSGKYDAVHNDCVAIGKLCESFGGTGGLAVAQHSPVPKDKVNEVTESAKQIADASRSLHKAAHADDLPQVKADYARMGNLVESLARYAGDR